MEKIYRKIADELCFKIDNEYPKIRDKINKSLFNALGLKNNFCNERTLAYYTTYLLENLFGTYVENLSIINEAAFKMEKFISKKDELACQNEVGNMTNKSFNNLFEPDTVASFTYKEIEYRYFIEYKVHNKYFKFIQLANDYLKYKIYTSSTPIDTKFIYIIFNKKTDGLPMIRDSSEPTTRIQLLNRIIAKKDIDKLANIFIYDPSLDIAKNIRPKVLGEEIGKREISVLDNVIKKIDELNEDEIDINFNNIKDFSKSSFIKNIECLGKNVATANIIKVHFNQIYNLSTMLDINYDDLKNKVGKTNKIVTEDDLFVWAKNYFVNLINKHLGEKLNNYNKVLIAGNKRKSLIILILIEKYCKDNNIDFKLKINDEEAKDLNEIYKMPFYKKLYTSGVYEENYSELIHTIIYFIVGLYTKIFDINEKNDDQILKYNFEYKNYLVKKEILNDLKKIKNLLGKKRNEQIEWDSDIVELGESLFEYVINNDYENE